MIRVEYVRPRRIALREQEHIAVSAHPCVGLFGTHRLGSQRYLTGRGNDFRLRKQHRHARLLSGAGSDREGDLRIIEIRDRLEPSGIVLVHHQQATLGPERPDEVDHQRAGDEVGER